MNVLPNRFFPFGDGDLALNTGHDAVTRGSDYLKQVRRVAPNPEMIDLPDDIVDRIRLCEGLGRYGDGINARLATYVEACHACFLEDQRRSLTVLAVPLAGRFGIDAFCNIWQDPVVILLDVGRIDPQDWLRVVAHEYTHAHLGSPGHGDRFFSILTHLCLGLGIEPPPPMESPAERERLLRNWPPCRATLDPQQFWFDLALSA